MRAWMNYILFQWCQREPRRFVKDANNKIAAKFIVFSYLEWFGDRHYGVSHIVSLPPGGEELIQDVEHIAEHLPEDFPTHVFTEFLMCREFKG